MSRHQRVVTLAIVLSFLLFFWYMYVADMGVFVYVWRTVLIIVRPS